MIRAIAAVSQNNVFGDSKTNAGKNKTDKAIELGIKMISEIEFEEMIKG